MIRIFLGFLLLISLFVKPAFAVERFSVSASLEQANESSSITSANAISGDGKLIVFKSYGSNLIEGGTNGRQHIFVKNRISGRVRLVSVSSAGEQGNGSSNYPVISKNGRYVVFTSAADNLVPDDNDISTDIFIHDLATGVTQQIADGGSGPLAITANGRYVAYGDAQHITVLDRQTTHEQMINRGNYRYKEIEMSADGRYVFFQTKSALVPEDFEPDPGCDYHDCFYGWHDDIYVYDRQHNTTEIVSDHNEYTFLSQVSDDGRTVVIFEGGTYDGGDPYAKIIQLDTGEVEGVNYESSYPYMDQSGRYLVFASSSPNIVYSGTINSLNYRNTYIKDRQTGRIKVLSLSLNGTSANGSSYNPVISADGQHIFFNSYATNLVENDTNDRTDVFSAENPFLNEINLVGSPSVNSTSDTGVYVWKNNVGTTFVKVVAGEQNGAVRNFSGSVISEDLIHSVNPVSIEFSTGDQLTQVDSARLDFNLYVADPYKDVFSFQSEINKSLCMLLNNYRGGLYLGPDKIEVNPPFDIHNQSICDVRTIPMLGAPLVDKNKDHGIFLWKLTNEIYKASVVSADGFSVVDINIHSEQPLSNFTPLGLEGNDVVNVSSNDIDLTLRVAAGAKDGFKFKALENSNTCFSNDSLMPIYVGPLRAKLNNVINLDTLKICQ